jgi:hypothetical protein
MKVEVYFTDIDANQLVIKTGVFKTRLEIAAACLIHVNKASDLNSAMMYLEGEGVRCDDLLSAGFDKVMSLGSENHFFPELIYINKILKWSSNQIETTKF